MLGNLWIHRFDCGLHAPSWYLSLPIDFSAKTPGWSNPPGFNLLTKTGGNLLTLYFRHWIIHSWPSLPFPSFSILKTKNWHQNTQWIQSPRYTEGLRRDHICFNFWIILTATDIEKSAIRGSRENNPILLNRGDISNSILSTDYADFVQTPRERWHTVYSWKPTRKALQRGKRVTQQIIPVVSSRIGANRRSKTVNLGT